MQYLYLEDTDLIGQESIAIMHVSIENGSLCKIFPENCVSATRRQRYDSLIGALAKRSFLIENQLKKIFSYEYPI